MPETDRRRTAREHMEAEEHPVVMAPGGWYCETCNVQWVSPGHGGSGEVEPRPEESLDGS
jgi:hypothetical protein